MHLYYNKLSTVVQAASSLSQYHENIGCPAQNDRRRLPRLIILNKEGMLGFLLQKFTDLADVISDLHQESFSRGWWAQLFSQVVTTVVKSCSCRR